jgi:hypothetical protein
MKNRFQRPPPPQEEETANTLDVLQPPDEATEAAATTESADFPAEESESEPGQESPSGEATSDEPAFTTAGGDAGASEAAPTATSLASVTAPPSRLPIVAAAVVALAGVVLMLLSAQSTSSSPFFQLLARLGIHGSHLVLFGLLLAAFATSRRRQQAIDRRLSHLEQSTAGSGDGLQLRLEQLLGSFESRPPAEGEELQRVMLALHRQDEKTNNLTRAIKMYGKPMIEISNQVTETGSKVAELTRHLDAMKTAFEHGLRELRAELGKGQDPKDHIKALESSLDQTRKQIAGGVERLLAATAEKPGVTAQDVEKQLDAALKQIQQSLGTATTSLTQSLSQSMAQSLQQLQQSLGRLQVAAPPSPSARVTSGPAPAPAPIHAPAHEAAPAPLPPAPPPPGETGPGGLAHSIAGSKTSSSSGLMSSIAKLKQLRK